MSSFKRKGASKQTTVTIYPGTRASSASNISIITSTGVASLDDILGGGLPLSCLLLLAAPDVHSSYGELIQKYFTAQGLADGHRVYIVGQDPDSFAKDIMWVVSRSSTQKSMSEDSDEEEKANLSQKVKIAWRYEKMKQFQPIIESTDQNPETFCHNFELSSRIPKEIIDDAVKSSQIQFLDLERRRLSMAVILDEIAKVIEADSSLPLRVCIPSLGSPVWGDVTTQSILHFLHRLKSTLRKHRHACASISLAPYISTESWGGVGWAQKLGWVSDAALTLAAFSGRFQGNLTEAILISNLGLSNMFPSHHGFVHIHTVPSPHTLSAPSDRFSCLRGLSSSGENNLGFKSTRKRVVFERLHLDIEGGIGERRTTEEVKKKTKERRQVIFKSDGIDF
ncbi:PAXNEB-domain-containing protein [Phlegmacium glaucopus]|nr:PAXNEB-domain-containing protein [Phlegmacium glaucopus]